MKTTLMGLVCCLAVLSACAPTLNDFGDGAKPQDVASVSGDELYEGQRGCEGEHASEGQSSTATIYFTPWRVMTPYPLGPSDLRLRGSSTLNVSGGKELEVINSWVTESENWPRRSQSRIINGRLLIDVRSIDGMVAILFADQFAVCNLSLDRCKENDPVFRQDLDALIGGSDR